MKILHCPNILAIKEAGGVTERVRQLRAIALIGTGVVAVAEIAGSAYGSTARSSDPASGPGILQREKVEKVAGLSSEYTFPGVDGLPARWIEISVGMFWLHCIHGFDG